MALWLCLQKFEGLIGGGPNPTRFIPGQIVDDTQDDVTAAIAAGAALVSYNAAYATALARFQEQFGAKDPDQTIMAALASAGVDPGGVAAPAGAWYVDPSFTGTSTGSRSNPAKTYAAAAALASAGDVIYLAPGAYAEDIALVAGVAVVGLCPARSGLVAVAGKVTAVEAGTAYVENIVATEAADSALEITGAAAVVVVAKGCRFVAGAAATHGAQITAASGEVELWDCEVRATTGNANAALQITQGTIRGHEIALWHEDNDALALEETGAGATTVTLFDALFQGGIDVAAAAAQPTNTLHRADSTTGNLEALVTVSTNRFEWFGGDVDCGVASGDAIAGAGVFVWSDLRLTGTASNLAAALNGGIGAWDATDYSTRRLQARVDAPELDAYDNGGTATLTAAGQDAVFLGRGLLHGQTFAAITLGASLDIIAEEPGAPSNVIQVEVVDTGGAGPSTVAYAAGVLTIDLVGLTPNEDAIAALVNAGASAWTGILRANSGGGPAFGVVAAANLTGGVGEGFAVTAGGAVCTPTGESGGLAMSTASITDTSATVAVPNLTATLAAGDVVNVSVLSDGVSSQSMSLVLA